MKKFFALAICFIMLITVMTACSGNGNTVVTFPEDDYIWTEVDDGIMLVSYTGESETLNVPSEISGKPVTEIGPECFMRCSATTITLPNTLKRINSFAFRTCVSLETLVVPDSVSFISTKAFDDTKWYQNNKDEFFIVGDGVLIKYSGEKEKIEIPAEVKCIACPLGKDNVTVTDIVIPDGIKYICGDAFVKTEWRRSLTDEFTVIGDGILIKYAGNGGDVVIPDNVKTISGAFYDSTKAITVKVPDSVRRIESFSFACVNGLSDKSAPNTISNLKSIELPENIDYIGAAAFFNCSSLEKINLPSSVKFLECELFTYCAALKSVVVPENVLTIGYAALAESGIESITFNNSLRFIGDFVFLNDAGLASLELPEGLERIAIYAFANCSNMKNVTLPKSLKFAADSAFNGCSENLLFTVPAGSYAHSYCTSNEFKVDAR